MSAQLNKYSLRTRLSGLLLPIFMLLVAPGSQAYPTSYYKTQSVLSQGHWVKISVQGEGIFQITYDQLRSWGFEDPSKVAVYGYGPLTDTSGTFGTTHIDDLPQAATLHTDDGRILFYGESDAKISPISYDSWKLTRNYYDRTGVYFLTDSQPIQKIPTTAYKITWTSMDYPVLSTHYSLNFWENEAQNPMSAGVYFHDTPITKGDTRKITFRVRDFDTSESTNLKMTDAYLSYYFYMNSPKAENLVSSVDGNVKVTYTKNGKCTANTNSNWAYTSVTTGSIRFRKPDDNSGALADEDVTLNLSLDSESSATYAALDRVYLCYPRKSRLGSDSQLIMHYYSAKELQLVQVRDTPLDAVVWNIDDPSSISSYEIRRADDTEPGLLSVALSHQYSARTEPCRMLVFSPSATHPGVEYLGDVRNSNIHGASTPQMVIITTRTLEDEAKSLAEIHHKYQGIRVSVYAQDEIFNEFSSGTRSPMAYRRMAKMFYDREPDVFKYILLYGPGSWDNRGISVAPDDRLLTFQVDIPEHARDYHRCYTTDQFFGMLMDDYAPDQIHYTPANVIVGRINVSTPPQAQSANVKIEDFMANPPSAAEFMRVTVSSDRGDSNAHYQQGVQVSSYFRSLLPGITVTEAQAVDYPVEGSTSVAHTVIMDAFRRGQGFFGYCGHGGPTGVTGIGILNMDQARREFFDTPTFAHFSSCDLFCFDRQNSLMDALISTPRGGIIGGVGASRSVYLEYNQPLYLGVVRNYANAYPGMTYGEIFFRARNEVAQAYGVSAAEATNTLCYNYLGDPAIPMPVPAYTIEIETIDGKPFNSEETTGLLPLSPVKITGYLVRKDGKSAADFTGEGLLEVYETPRLGAPQSVANPDYKTGNGQPQTITVRTSMDHSLIAESAFEVNEGRFEANVVLPELLTYGDLNRLVLTAKSTTTGDYAAGAFSTTKLTALPEDFQSQLNPEAPEILSMYIDTPEFMEDDLVPSDFTLYAEVRIPESGIDMAGNGLSSTARLSLDVSNHYKDIFSGATYTDHGTLLLKRSFDGIADGRHNLQLALRSNMGETTEREIEFCVLATGIEGTLTCKDSMTADSENDDNAAPVRIGATFDLNHGLDKQPNARLLIFDSMGQTVYSANGVNFPYTWDLKANDGTPVADGLYNAKVMLSSGNTFGHTDQISFMVIK